MAGTQVTVVTQVERDSYFAKIFGEETLTASAEASSGCYSPRGKGVIPLAWNCRAPTVGMGDPFPEEYGCQVQTLNWQELQPLVEGSISHLEIEDFDGNTDDYYMGGPGDTSVINASGIPPEQIYIIIDSDKICLEDDPLIGTIQCDLDGDGKKDLQFGGDRGWLYLTAGTSDIKKWITDYGAHPDFTLEAHKWLSGKSGMEVDVINAMVTEGYPGEVVMIPVYNVICENDPTEDPSCVDAAHASPPWPVFSGVDDFSQIRNSGPYYHIITFEPFYITCVNKKGNCPGYEYAQTLPTGDELDKFTPVIEGFFLSDVGVSPDASYGCDLNLGNCIISLSK